MDSTRAVARHSRLPRVHPPRRDTEDRRGPGVGPDVGRRGRGCGGGPGSDLPFPACMGPAGDRTRDPCRDAQVERLRFAHGDAVPWAVPGGTSPSPAPIVVPAPGALGARPPCARLPMEGPRGVPREQPHRAGGSGVRAGGALAPTSLMRVSGELDPADGVNRGLPSACDHHSPGKRTPPGDRDDGTSDERRATMVHHRTHVWVYIHHESHPCNSRGARKASRGSRRSVTPP